ncbi:MAG: hypothetical protein JRH06_04670 [Deltaproteobacteria bacterium]|nr:hypothetical protein [Deltaproteobacteria bacterium]MBW2136832.1 hypothetical protein [Deltaproteobacteria bacterium]
MLAVKGMKISISPKAKRFMEERGIEDVTFHLRESEAVGCCLGIVKEIEPVYRAVKNASDYRYFYTEGKHIFVSRKIKILGPLTITTEGFWKTKRLALSGATVPI